MAFGEDMGTPCNITDSGNYAARHKPFLYYDDIQTNAARCNAHVVDFAAFYPDSAPEFTFIAPNLVDDMHNPDPPNPTQHPERRHVARPDGGGDHGSNAYKQGGLLVIVWDEDDGSGGIRATPTTRSASSSCRRTPRPAAT